MREFYSPGIREPRIIELGCGSGWFSAIAGIFGPTVGVDLSGEAIRLAAEKYPHVDFIQANFFEWAYPKEAFDIVISQEVIEHVEDQEGYLLIAHSLLKDGGYLILTTPNKSAFDAMPEEQCNSWLNQPIEKLLTLNELRNLLKKHFKIIRLTTIIPGYGTKGLYRLMNSMRLRSVMIRIGLHKWFDQLRLSLGFGLHIFAIAQKRNQS